jgi:GDPmannose 4,6-dehydratase
VNYRESYGLFACSGLLYNHESPLRGRQFVTRKISRGVAEIALGRRESLTLGNLDVRRDWGAAQDYVQSMRLMLAQSEPADYIIASGVCRSLYELLAVAFGAAGLGDGMDYVRQDPDLMRPADVSELRGDLTKASQQLGWKPTVTFEEIIEHMVHADMERLTRGIEEDPDYLDSRRPSSAAGSGATHDGTG